jgi:hypothetical protein
VVQSISIAVQPDPTSEIPEQVLDVPARTTSNLEDGLSLMIGDRNE